MRFFQKGKGEAEDEGKNMTGWTKFRAAVFVSVFLAVCLAGCGAGTGIKQKPDNPSGNSGKVQKEIFAMDTIMTVTAYGEKAEAAVGKAMARIQQMEKEFSVTNQDSDTARLNRSDGEIVTVSEDTYSLIGLCQAVSDKTGGLFDISIYPLVKAWGFTTDSMHIPTSEEREMALSFVDYKKIKRLGKNRVQVPKGMQLDLGAAAKGYLSQALMDLFSESGVDSAIVSLGGNVQTIGKKQDGGEFVVGLTDPADGTSVYGTLSVCDKAVVTSGIYQRYFEENGVRYHHIMDKRTGMPAENGLASVTVISENGTEADALATALYVMGEKEAAAYQKKHPEIALVLIRRDGSFWQSDGVNLKRG